MPDPDLITVSSSHVAGLFNRSPYETRFMLHHHYTGERPLHEDDTKRTRWGKRIQQAILEWASEQLHLEIAENTEDLYFRNIGRGVGCTPDGLCWSPDKGLGYIEAKNVDAIQYKRSWTSKAAPEHIELQLQAQLMVGPTANHDTLAPYHDKHPNWGAIVVLIGGNEPKMLMRETMPRVQGRIEKQAKSFLRDVKNRKPPPVAGWPIELPVLGDLYADGGDGPLSIDDLSDEEILEIQELCAAYRYWSRQRSIGEKAATQCRVRLLAIAGLADVIRVPGYRVKVTRLRSDKVSAHLPPDLAENSRLAAEMVDDREVQERLRAAADWEQHIRAASAQSRLTIKHFAEEVDQDEGKVWNLGD